MIRAANIPGRKRQSRTLWKLVVRITQPETIAVASIVAPYECRFTRSSSVRGTSREGSKSIRRLSASSVTPCPRAAGHHCAQATIGILLRAIVLICIPVAVALDVQRGCGSRTDRAARGSAPGCTDSFFAGARSFGRPFGSLLQAPALTFELEHMSPVHQTVQERGDNDGVAEELGPVFHLAI